MTRQVRLPQRAAGPGSPRPPGGLNAGQRLLKRTFDLVASAAGLVVLGWTVPVLMLAVRRSTGGSALFRQIRVGRHGRPFEIIKLRTMRFSDTSGTTVTTADDPRITRLGAFLRRAKLDELPQLVNVLRGEMSLVGPRPDVPGFVETQGPRARTILSVAPGITGPATLVFRDEELVLSRQPDPEEYNARVLLPAKARINEHYVRTWSFARDLHYILLTLRGASLSEDEALQ